MLVIPALDLRAGQCVRRRQGRYEEETEYFQDPVAMAKLWRVMNARVLHLVDLDASVPVGPTVPATDAPHNHPVVAEIARALDIPVQTGGGLRSMADIEELLGLGVYRVILGTAAVTDPDLVSRAVERFGCSRIVVAVDAREGEVLTDGRRTGSGVDALALGRDMEARGVRRFVYTDTLREGTLGGPDVAAARRFAEALRFARVTASGGVSGHADLLALQAAEPSGIDSVIVGRALYENAFPCQRFWCWHHKDDLDLDCFSTARLAG